MTNLWWAIFLGMNAAVVIGCVLVILRFGRPLTVWLCGTLIVAFVIPLISMMLIGPMAQVDPTIHGGSGTGIGYAIPMVAIAALAMHTLAVFITIAEKSSRRRALQRSSEQPPSS